MKLTDNEKKHVIKLIEEGMVLPEKYRFLLFDESRQVELNWNGKSDEVTNVALPFQIIEQIEEPRNEDVKNAQEKLDFDFGGFTIFGKKYNPKEFMEFAIKLDNLPDDRVKILYKMSKNAFSAKLRNKLRHLRTIKAYLKAQEKNELSQFLMVVYFRAAKMNITDEDLVSPFLKVSS